MERNRFDRPFITLWHHRSLSPVTSTTKMVGLSCRTTKSTRQLLSSPRAHALSVAHSRQVPSGAYPRQVLVLGSACIATRSGIVQQSGSGFTYAQVHIRPSKRTWRLYIAGLSHPPCIWLSICTAFQIYSTPLKYMWPCSNS